MKQFWNNSIVKKPPLHHDKENKLIKTPYGSLTTVLMTISVRQKSLEECLSNKLEHKGQIEDFTGGAYSCKSSYKGQTKEHTGKAYSHEKGHKHPTKELMVYGLRL